VGWGIPGLGGGSVYNAREMVNERRIQDPVRGSTDHGSVDPKGVDFPISIYERLGVLVDD